MAIAGSGLEAEEILHVDSSTSSPGSARQWVYDGTQSSIGNAGPEIVLGTKGGLESVVPDLHLSFDGDVPADSGGRWRVETFGPYERAGDARLGDGAGVFKAPLTHLVVTPGEKALFIPNLPIEDLSIEFWIKPTRADSGEIVFLWKANRITGKTSFSQQISCIVLRNRLVFGFINFFTAPDGKPSTISLPGVSTLVPGVWSHHLVRFDASTGLLEYLMNGSAEAISYATSTGKQSGTIFTPIPGGSGRLEIADRCRPHRRVQHYSKLHSRRGTPALPRKRRVGTITRLGPGGYKHVSAIHRGTFQDARRISGTLELSLDRFVGSLAR
ncbi:hypothetical protein MASR2M48_18030 [Spirochaetota bacterium]